jgi:ketosteroid isomerase-like protein
MSTHAAVLYRWHDAVNSGDVEGVVRECAPDVAVIGPRGSWKGHDQVREWLQRTGIRLTPVDELVERDGRFVVRERIQWTTEEDEPRETHCVFVVTEGKISSITRYDDPGEIPSA